MVRVFVSYSTKDVDFVSRVVSGLDEAGIFTFFSAVDIRPGMDLLEWINISVQQSTHFLLFWSRQAESSRWVKQEWESRFWQAVEDTTGVLIPIRLDDTPLPPMLKKVAYLRGADGVEAVVKGVQSALMPDTDFAATRRRRLRELSGYDVAVQQVAEQTQQLVVAHPHSMETAVFDFYYPPAMEGVFLAQLRSTGVRALIGMERKGVKSGIMRLTGHLTGPRDAFAYMEQLLRSSGFTVDRMS